MPEHVSDHLETVRVRRAPKMSVFLLLGAALGVLAAMILTFAFDGSSDVSPNTGLVYSQGQVFGFLTLVCVPVGLALAAVVALLLDRRSRSHTREIIVDHESVQVEQFEDPDDEPSRG
ncbi:potassium transporter Trk [Microbacterium sp. CFBP9034]|uniref:potassium transporter Trk n=1 Tax=Microbacterium sp. CFBP9034 TaxID=3096540 RepID=UPI002A69B756|nr:potassium transporter Trk [Microbacterium sp. CFBP9034]MDY0908000.1 potassium transporter Trk [Microbacterium sp. CFBP9034]